MASRTSFRKCGIWVAVESVQFLFHFFFFFLVYLSRLQFKQMLFHCNTCVYRRVYFLPWGLHLDFVLFFSFFVLWNNSHFSWYQWMNFFLYVYMDLRWSECEWGKFTSQFHFGRLVTLSKFKPNSQNSFLQIVDVMAWVALQVW